MLFFGVRADLIIFLDRNIESKDITCNENTLKEKLKSFGYTEKFSEGRKVPIGYSRKVKSSFCMFTLYSSLSNPSAKTCSPVGFELSFEREFFRECFFLVLLPFSSVCQSTITVTGL